MTNSALCALNHIENGGRVLVTLPGFEFSTIFYIENAKIYAENDAIGPCEIATKGEVYAHFCAMLSQGGQLVNA